MPRVGRSWVPRSIPARTRGPAPRDAAEHGTRSQPGTAGIVEIEQPAHQLSRRVQAADRLVVGVEDFGVRGNPQSAESEGEAAGHRVALKWRRIDGVRPVAFVDGE